MRILHVLDRSVPNISGYASRSKYIMEFQRMAGLDPVAVTSPRQRSAVVDVERIGELDYYRSRLPSGRITAAVDRIPYLCECQLMRCLERRIDNVVCATRVDVIHAHSPILGGIPASRVSVRRGIPLVYEVRALWEDAAVDQEKTGEGSLRYRIIRHLETRLLKRSDAVIAICEGLKDEIVSRGIERRRIQVVPNGVDTDRFGPMHCDRALAASLGADGLFVIGFIGQSFAFEGLDVLLRAMVELVKQRQACRLVIVGSGQEEHKLQMLSHDLGLDGHVVFTGQVPHADVVRYYSIMDVLVYPRLRRRITDMVTPIKPLEAMSMRKTVVASDVGGLKELVTDGVTGLLFRAEDEGDLAQTLLRCVDSPALRERLGAAARTAMVELRNWKAIMSPYPDLYGGLIEQRRRA